MSIIGQISKNKTVSLIFTHRKWKLHAEHDARDTDCAD